MKKYFIFHIKNMKFIKNFLLFLFVLLIYGYTWVFAAVDHFEVTLDPTKAKVGEALDLTIKAVDKNNNKILDYKWTILIFSETDPEAVLPNSIEENSYIFSASDQWERKFENWVIFKSAWKHDIHIFDLNDDRIYWIAEAEISAGSTQTNLDISIISPENWLTIWNNFISVSWLTEKNHQVKITVNWKDDFLTTSNNEWIYEKNIDKLVDWENTFKAFVLDSSSKVVWESDIKKIKVELSNLEIKNVKITPAKVDPESSYEIEVTATPKLNIVNIIINDTIVALKETKLWIYTSKNIAPKNPWPYSIDVIVKNEFGHEKRELGAASLTVNELPVTEPVPEPIEVYEEKPPIITSTWTECSENIEHKITWLKLVELKTKSILTWDKIIGVNGYNVYKKLENWEFELIENVSDSKFEIEITGDEIKYDYFAVRAVSKNTCWEEFEWTLSDATKIKTGPELIILLAISLLIWWYIAIKRNKNA